MARPGVSSGKPWRGHQHRIAGDGSRVEYDVSVSPVCGEAGDIRRCVLGEARRCIRIERDVTRERQLESQLVHVQKMEAIGRLTGGIAAIDRDRLNTAIQEVAPALVTTSLVLILGMSGVFFADNREVGDFGKIAITVYGLALVADLLVLPAVLAVFGPRTYLKRRKESQ